MQITQKFCDLEHSKPAEATETVTIVNGRALFDLDLCASHWDGLKDQARRHIGDRAPRAPQAKTNGKTPAMREWLRAQGRTVSDRGKLSKEDINLYNAAHT